MYIVKNDSNYNVLGEKLSPRKLGYYQDEKKLQLVADFERLAHVKQYETILEALIDIENITGLRGKVVLIDDNAEVAFETTNALIYTKSSWSIEYESENN